MFASKIRGTFLNIRRYKKKKKKSHSRGHTAQHENKRPSKKNKASNIKDFILQKSNLTSHTEPSKDHHSTQ